MKPVYSVAFVSAALLISFAECSSAFQSSNPPSGMTSAGQMLKQRSTPSQPEDAIRIEPGTHILLNMINSVSTKQAAVGDRIYLETAFPVLSDSRIVIPQGSWVTGTVTEVKRPGRVKGRGALRVSFDSITLPNGVTRNLRSDLGAVDAGSGETLSREQSKVTGPGHKKGDTETVAGTTATGTVIGSGIGAAAGSVARGAGIGAGAGAAAGLIGVLFSRGPDAMLTKGSTVEIVLGRPLVFHNSDLEFSGAPPQRSLNQGNTPEPQHQTSGWKPVLR